MSIEELILDHVGSCELFRLTPTRPKNVKNRRVFLSPSVMWLLENDHRDEIANQRCVKLLRDLESFADNGLIGVCMTPYEANEEARLGLLAPPADGIWDYRSVAPSPGLRIVGGFAAKDTFVGLEWAPRSISFLEKEPLLDRDSREWRDIIEATKAHWKRLFTAWPPLKEESLDEYLSENCHLV